MCNVHAVKISVGHKKGFINQSVKDTKVQALKNAVIYGLRLNYKNVVFSKIVSQAYF